MAEYISVSQISKYVGQEVTVKGWVYNRTDKGKLVFLLVRDGSGFVGRARTCSVRTPISSCSGRGAWRVRRAPR